MSDLLAEMWLGMRARSPVKLAWGAIAKLKDEAMRVVPEHSHKIQTQFMKLQQYYNANSRVALVTLRSKLSPGIRLALQKPKDEHIRSVVSAHSEAIDACTQSIGVDVMELCRGIPTDRLENLRQFACSVVTALDRI